MQDNPYNTLIEMMQGGKVEPAIFMLGEVVSLSPFRVKIETPSGSLELDSDDLLINDFLNGGQERKYNLSDVTLAGTSSTGSATLTTSGGYLKKGDKVALLPSEDKQLYILLCKVVKP